eukprot:gb/GECG01003620.1/.p1 GENE.gb/GECG01003620.1/~~gb/GECG01003620.1/.p1  ORF type:complete len:175 (+),score=9.56 gb/GECG01003620.1/:1-525(+)
MDSYYRNEPMFTISSSTREWSANFSLPDVSAVFEDWYLSFHDSLDSLLLRDRSSLEGLGFFGDLSFDLFVSTERLRDGDFERERDRQEKRLLLRLLRRRDREGDLRDVRRGLLDLERGCEELRRPCPRWRDPSRERLRLLDRFLCGDSLRSLLECRSFRGSRLSSAWFFLDLPE